MVEVNCLFELVFLLDFCPGHSGFQPGISGGASAADSSDRSPRRGGKKKWRARSRQKWY